MNKQIKTIAKYVLPFWVVEKLKFPTEAAIAAGRKPPLRDERSALLFTLNKCASTFTPAVMHYFNVRTRRLKELDFEGYFYNKGGPDFKERMLDRPEQFFRPKGMMMAPLRRYYPVENLDAFTKILVLRDPRDLLTSKYFSQAYVHSVPLNPEKRKLFFERRARVQNQTIDEFVLEWMDRIKEDFAEYREMCAREEVELIRYEDIILDFENAMRAFARAWNYPISPEEIEELRRIGGYDKPPEGETLKAHTRKRLPGDHKEKLKPETIEVLNQLFADELEWLDYES